MKTECRLIYIDEQVDINGNPVNIETSKTVKCDDIGQWSSGYYEDRNRDMMLSCNLRIARNYLHSSCGQLRYVDYRCIRYEIKQILSDKKRKMKCILDVEEYKF
jgi:hypothetical protein